MQTEIITHSPAETEALGARLAAHLTETGKRRAFIAFFGEMGVGKTAFARGFAEALGARATRSPTYTVVNEYRTAGLPIFHFDLYRIADADELYAIGFDDYLAREGFCLCEWSENGDGMLPDDRISVTISRVPGEDESRRILLEGVML